VLERGPSAKCQLETGKTTWAALEDFQAENEAKFEVEVEAIYEWALCLALLKRKTQLEHTYDDGVAFGKLWICALHACNVQKLRLMPH